MLIHFNMLHMLNKSLKDANPLQYAAHAQQASIDGFNTSF